MSKKPIVIPAKPKQADTSKGELSYPLTLHRPPQKPGELWIEITVDSPAELAVELFDTHNEELYTK